MENTIVIELSPLPDFLKGHTLSSKETAARLKESLSQWVQFVGSLWSWNNMATFAIRYHAQGGKIRIWFLAKPHDLQKREMLLNDVLVLCRSHNLPVKTVTEKLLKAPGGPLIPWENSSIVEIRQFQTKNLWKVPKTLLARPEYADLKKYYTLTNLDCEVLFPWQAPGGSFLLPMEKLLSQQVPTGITIYLQPTELTQDERDYLSLHAKVAQSSSDQHRQSLDQAAGTKYSDPIAGTVAQVFSSNVRRLTDKPFLVSVHCVASNGRLDIAQSIAGAIEATLYETPFDFEVSQRDALRLPSAGETRIPTVENNLLTTLHEQYVNLRFTSLNQDYKSRLPYLVDARGAATTFRLPISIAGGVPGIVVKQQPPDFHPGPRLTAVDPTKEIDLGTLYQGGHAKIDRNAMCKHALITGFTGSGKTETVLGLIHQIHEGGTPVLAIESAKREYRGLMGVPAFSKCKDPVWVFSVGNETCAPFRLNPFEILPGVRVEQHISRIQTCIEAALPPIGPLASMIGEAIVDIYEERGWRLTDVAPEIGEPMLLTFPDMKDFAKRMAEIPEERNYQDEVLSNVTAAITGRIKPLTIGGKGLIFRPEKQYKPGELREESAITRIFNRTTILELEELSVEDKAFFVMIVLTFLREYRDRNVSKDGSIKHVTVVEEAHNVLENVSSNGQSESGSGDSRYKAVQAFSLMLSEIRALGEGLIIADQSPEKLAPDAMRNTNLHIAHQLRDSTDRDAVARAMIMDDEQRDYLGKLTPGSAALFMTGLQKATFITVPRYRPPVSETGVPIDSKKYPGTGFSIPDNDYVREYMNPVTQTYKTGPFDTACSKCKNRLSCNRRISILRAMLDPQYVEEYTNAHRNLSSIDALNAYAKASTRLATAAFKKADAHDAWCSFVHLWFAVPENKHEEFPVFAYDWMIDKFLSTLE